MVFLDYSTAKKMENLSYEARADIRAKSMNTAGPIFAIRSEQSVNTWLSFAFSYISFASGIVRYIQTADSVSLRFIPFTTGVMYQDLRVGANTSSLTIQGNTTQMATGDSISITVFRRGQPQNPIFSQTINTTGPFSVSVLLPDGRSEWRARITATLNQTSTPIVIDNLQVIRDAYELPTRKPRWSTYFKGTLGIIFDSNMGTSFPPLLIWRDTTNGYITNTPPTYDKLVFVPRQVGKVFCDFATGISNLVLLIKGNVTQLAVGDTISFYAYPFGYREGITLIHSISQAGNFIITWPPPYRANWVVRVEANFSQTMQPAIIDDFNIWRATGEIYNVNVPDSVALTLSDSANLTPFLGLSDGIFATLSDQATLSAPISLSDSLSPTLSDSASTMMSAEVTESVAAILSDSGAISATISTSDSIAPTLQDIADLTSNLGVSDNLSATLQDGAQANAQVSATDSIAPTLEENVTAENIYEIGVSDQITPTLSDNSMMAGEVTAADTVGVTLQETTSAAAQVSVNDTTNATLTSAPSTLVGATISETIQPTITDQASSQATVMAQEVANITAAETTTTEVGTAVSESYEVTVANALMTQPNISVTEETSLIASEGIRQFTGWNYIIVEPLDVNVHGEEVEVSVEEEEIQISG